MRKILIALLAAALVGTAPAMAQHGHAGGGHAAVHGGGFHGGGFHGHNGWAGPGIGVGLGLGALGVAGALACPRVIVGYDDFGRAIYERQC